MWDDYMPVRKATLYPYLVLLVVGLGILDNAGYIDLAAQAQSAKAIHRQSHKATHRQSAKSIPPSQSARADIPARSLRLYRQTCHGERWGRYACWAVLAGIGKVESDHGRSRAPGVRSGVNRFGCCAGPMQFNLRNGPPSTWDTYGHGSPYDPADAIPAAKRLLVANGARRNLDTAIWNYNHSWSYVGRVKALASSYQG